MTLDVPPLLWTSLSSSLKWTEANSSVSWGEGHVAPCLTLTILVFCPELKQVVNLLSHLSLILKKRRRRKVNARKKKRKREKLPPQKSAGQSGKPPGRQSVPRPVLFNNFWGSAKAHRSPMWVIPLTHKHFHYGVLKASRCLRNGNRQELAFPLRIPATAPLSSPVTGCAASFPWWRQMRSKMKTAVRNGKGEKHFRNPESVPFPLALNAAGKHLLCCWKVTGIHFDLVTFALLSLKASHCKHVFNEQDNAWILQQTLRIQTKTVLGSH